MTKSLKKQKRSKRPKISIVIRTKNEERWITACLTAIFSQKHKDFEVIIVDNESSDKTIEKASQFNITKVITCKDYRPGLALNMGFKEAKGEYVVCLSGHCIPVNEKWREYTESKNRLLLRLIRTSEIFRSSLA